MLPALDNAQLTLPNSSLGISSYELSHGGPPRKSFEWKSPIDSRNAKETLSNGEAKQFVDSLRRAYALPDFQIGDMVWLSAKNLKTDRPSSKLDYQQRGLFKILSMKGTSYELELPSSWRIHSVFHASHLRKSSSDPLPGQVIDWPTPVNIIGDDEYEVLRIKASKEIAVQLYYQEEWVGVVLVMVEITMTKGNHHWN
ncbi:hypothetical protein K3495_g9204 [Podosphaera aphanis]|nr:hypothetical protein K3495_g9204 [Podosphaera aphanis]